ncbi:hypothetical protein M8J75_001971 [Diaphorina citri]|nr:hypothetical protein M8J75_001971 [Diaphorina citri]
MQARSAALGKDLDEVSVHKGIDDIEGPDFTMSKSTSSNISRWWLSRSKSDVENHLLSNSEDLDDYADVNTPIVFNGKPGSKISIVGSKVENSPVRYSLNPHFGGIQAGLSMDVFMKNKAIYLQFDLKNHTDIREKNATIDYLYHIRKNIDTACATKVLLANTMLSQYKRQQFVKVSELFQFAQFYSMEFKRICGELPRGLESPFKVTLVEEPSLGDRIAQNIYDNHPRVAVDLEGYNLGQFGLITLCQVSVSPDHVYLFDILKCPYFLRQGVLKKILETRKVTKVLHGIAGDVANLYRQFNITLRNVYDTQISNSSQ